MTGLCFGCLEWIDDWPGTSNSHYTGDGDCCGPVMSAEDARTYALNDIEAAAETVHHCLGAIAQADDIIRLDSLPVPTSEVTGG